MELDEFGAFLISTNLVFFISLVGMWGLNQSLIRLVSGRNVSTTLNQLSQLIRNAWKIAVVIGFLTSLLFGLILISPIGKWLEVDLRHIVPILVCSLLLSAHRILSTLLRSVHAAGMSGLLDGRTGGPLVYTLFLALAAKAASTNFTAVQALWGFAACLLIPLPLAWFMWQMAWKNAAKKFSNEETALTPQLLPNELTLVQVYVLSLPYLLTQVTAYFGGEFDVWIANAYSSADDTALFASAKRLIFQTQLPLQVFALTASASIAEFYAKGDMLSLKRMLRKTANILCGMTLPVLFVCTIFPGFVMGLVFGAKFTAGATVFAILTVGQYFNCLSGQAGQVLLLSGNSRIPLVINTLSAVFTLIVGVFAASNFGIIGLAISSTTVTSVTFLSLWFFAKTKVGVWTNPWANFKIR